MPGATPVDSVDLEHFHYHRKFCWAVLLLWCHHLNWYEVFERPQNPFEGKWWKMVDQALAREHSYVYILSSVLLFLSNFIRSMHTLPHKRSVLSVHRVQRSKNYFQLGKRSDSQRRRDTVVEERLSHAGGRAWAEAQRQTGSSLEDSTPPLSQPPAWGSHPRQLADYLSAPCQVMGVNV